MTAGGLSIGLFSLGLEAYWPQFPGLKDRLLDYNRRIANRLARDGVHLENLGLIDTPEQAAEAGHQFRRADVDIIFLHLATYGLSSTVLPSVRRARVPVVILNLAPADAIDYAAFNRLPERHSMTAEWLAWCNACPAPEIASVLRRAHLPFFQITGTLADSDPAWAEIDEWIEAARVAYVMEHNRLGLMGHYYGGMLDVYSDLTQQCTVFGGHIEILEVDELSALRREVTGAEIEQRVALFHESFDVRPDCSESELTRAARTSVALDRLAAGHNLGSLAYYHRGGNPENEDAVSSIILAASLLTARGIPVAGEYEVKNAQAMKIMDSFGAGGSFSEYYAADFKDDVILFGHDGPGHVAIAEGKPKVKPLRVYHGKIGSGLSIEMSVKHGPVTLLSVAQSASGAGVKLIVAEAASEPGPILEIGNTNSRYRFPLSAREFMPAWNAQGPAHHCAIGVGHIASKLEKLAALLNMDCVKVC